MELRSVTSKDSGSKKTVWKTLTVREKLMLVLKVAASKRLTGGYVSLLLRNETKACPLPLIIRISLNKVNFGYQSLFLKISLEKRRRLIKCWHLTFLHPWNCKLTCVRVMLTILMCTIFQRSELESATWIGGSLQSPHTKTCDLTWTCTSETCRHLFTYLSYYIYITCIWTEFLSENEMKVIYCSKCCIIYFKQFSSQWAHGNGLQIQTKQTAISSKWIIHVLVKYLWFSGFF